MGLPLEGIRILDLSWIWAGPYATKLLADMGAEVIKIEAARAYDWHRGPVSPAPGAQGITSYPDGVPGERPWNRSGWFNSLNMNKRGITLDIHTPLGGQTFLELVRISDVVIENFRYGILERLGFGYDVLRCTKPDIVVVSMPAFGNSGPWRNYIGYGVGQELLAGMAHMTGYPGEDPMKSGINHGDPITGSHAAIAILSALFRRHRTGQGAFIDISHMESSVCLVGEYILGFQMTGRNPDRMGNRHPAMAPHGIYRCRGEDQWLTIAVESDAQWQCLCEVMGRADLAKSPQFTDVLSRWCHQDEMDSAITEWTQRMDAGEAAALLQNAGVAAAPVLTSRGLLNDAHFRARGVFKTVTHPETGTHLYPGMAWHMSSIKNKPYSSAPRLGEDNSYIYSELLGMTRRRLEEMEQEGVVSTIPQERRIT
ncbi:MAG: CoA transferase [Chloroflexi bacterium]|nr:CoA transferase [Chloroflexota bacterium]